MSTLTIEMSDKLREAAAAAAAASGFSLEHLISLAVQEKLSALHAIDFLRREGVAGQREDFERFLAAVPEVDPIETDRLSES